MKSSRVPPPPSAATDHVVGSGYDFARGHDRVNRDKPPAPPVELTPVGPAPGVYVFEAGHGQLPPPALPGGEETRVA